MTHPIENSHSLAGASDRSSLAPLPWPRADEAVHAALERVYASGDWGKYHGAECAALEAELAAAHGCAQASLCSSGTIAVELALRGLGVQPGDEVLLAAYDFPGNFRAIEAVGARPVLLDVNAADANLDIAQVTAAVSRQSKAIIASHLHGGIIDMRTLCAIAAETGLAVVEDACQCPGAWVQGKRAGAWGDVGVLSFGGSKLLTAGRGGALLTDDHAALQRIKVFRERGNDAFPLSELQAAVLRPQLERLDADNEQRLAAARRLQTGIANISTLRTFTQPAHIEDTTRQQPGYYKLGVWFQPQATSLYREEFSTAARLAGVALDPGFRGFAGRSERRCRKLGDLANARRAAEEVLILHHPVLLEDAATLDAVIAALASISSTAAPENQS